jgi:hypothetical protein
MPSITAADGVAHYPFSDPQEGWRVGGAEFMQALSSGNAGVSSLRESDWVGQLPRLRRASMSVTTLTTCPMRPCRLCALESVLFASSQVGERIYPVSFSGQSVPAEDGISRFTWSTVSTSGGERLTRIAKRLGLESVTTESGPVAYGLVTTCTRANLQRSLRTYDMPHEVASDVLSGSTRRSTGNRVSPGVFVSILWALRNQHPPELYGEEALITTTASALARSR